jgi:hypothetical protein
MLQLTCANLEFAARFRELNGSIVEGWSPRRGTLRRTPVGDWVLES